MSDKSFRCRLVTPTESLLDEPVTYANVPAHDGLIGIAPGRAPIVLKLGMGELTLHFPEATHGGGDRLYYIDGGFAHVGDGELLILAEKAIPAESIAEPDAERELAEAEAMKVPEGSADKAEAADEIRATRDRARTKLRIVRHRRSSGKGI